MKKLLGAFVVVMVALTAYGASPVPPWFKQQAGDLQLANASSGGEGQYAAHRARFIYDTATDGGTVGAHGLGVYLPARAVITRSYYKIITQFSDSGTGTVALSCEDANNIKSAVDFTGDSANAFVEGVSTGAASAYVRGIAADCEIKATVGGVTQATGKLVGWLDYVLED